MAQYGNGISLKKAFEFDRERIEHALKGELCCGETETGFEYAPCTREEADEYILEAFDNAVYHALNLARTGEIYEEIIRENTDIDEAELFKKYREKIDASISEHVNPSNI